MIAFYNSERLRCHAEFDVRVNEGVVTADPRVQETYLLNIRSNDTTRISWSRGLFRQFCKNEEISVSDDIRTVAYRPYCKKNLAYTKSIIEMPSRWDSMQAIVNATDNQLMNGFSRTDIFNITNAIESRIQKGNLKTVLGKLVELQQPESGRGLVISYDESIDSIFVVDLQLLFYRKYHTMKWPWEELAEEARQQSLFDEDGQDHKIKLRNGLLTIYTYFAE